MYVICGSGAGIGRCSDVWKFALKEPNGWTKISAEKGGEHRGDHPSDRDGHTVNYIGDGKFLLFGGQGLAEANPKTDRPSDPVKSKTMMVRDAMNDMYIFDCETESWASQHVTGTLFPFCRRGHSAVYVGDGALTRVNTTALNKRTGSGSRRGSRKKVSVESEGIPRKSLLVFGGAGTDAGKNTQQLYNDVWAFSLETSRWHRIWTKGATPRIMYDHKAEIIGETMIVVGGIWGPVKTNILNAEEFTHNTIFSLNLKTLVWTPLEIFESPNG